MMEKPYAHAKSSGTLKPGEIVYVSEIKDDWAVVCSHGDALVYVNRREQGFPILIPLVENLFEKSLLLPAGSSLRVRSDPRQESDVIQVTNARYFLGNLQREHSSWVNVSHSDYEDFTSQSWMLKSMSVANTESSSYVNHNKATSILEEIPIQSLTFFMLSSSLPAEAIVRVRSEPKEDSEIVYNMTCNEIFTSIKENRDSDAPTSEEGKLKMGSLGDWVFIMDPGRIGWIKKRFGDIELLETVDRSLVPGEDYIEGGND